MTVGEKIKKIRTFRGMTQKELGLAIGFEEKGADNRIAQYETCLLYTSPSPRDAHESRMPSSA